MRARTRAVVAALALALTVSACTDDAPMPVATAVEASLTLAADLGPVRIGVLVPAVEGEGSEFRPLVEGARVAGYRFALDEHVVDLEVALDDGTATGATAAMRSLVDAEVAGVVLAAQGDHLAGALEVAEQAGTAVVMPFGAPSVVSDGVWSTAPSARAVADQVVAALEQAGAERPYLLTAPGRTLDLAAAVTGDLDDPRAAAQEVVAALEARQVDAVVVAGGAVEQAALVVAVQELLGARQLPVVLTPEALTPAFGDALAAAGAPVGLVTAAGTRPGDGAEAFRTALRLAAGDPVCRNVYDDDACAVGVPRAGQAAHDATVALVRAAERAGSTSPSAVRKALGGSRLGAAEGLAGPDLDFGPDGGDALADVDVVVLHAATSPSAVRPSAAAGVAEPLTWFLGVDG